MGFLSTSVWYRLPSSHLLQGFYSKEKERNGSPSVHQIRWRKIKIDSIIAYRVCFIIVGDHECSKLGRQGKFKVYKFN